MNRFSNPKLTPNARALRKNMTREEQRLWYDFLRDLPVPVNRQKVIGQFIVDFYIPSAGLVIELDGGQHYEEQGKAADADRDAFLRKMGLAVRRYSNLDVQQNFPGVCEDILKAIEIIQRAEK